MKVLYISQFYEPESIAAAFRATEHSREWTSAGADVTVFTGYPNYPTGKIFDAYNVELLSESELEGVRLLRSKLVAKPNTSFINRVENGLSFLWYGLVNLRTNRNKIESDYDCVLATSGTVFAGYLGYKFARSLKKPFVIEFRDITYSQLVATGTTKKSVKYRLMKRLELFLANRAKQVIVVTSLA
ncbi:MAG: glycosyltransferase [Raoultibacter sp.]|jgi:colanic acid biosynthesis glycosyl transferase WcaI